MKQSIGIIKYSNNRRKNTVLITEYKPYGINTGMFFVAILLK
jgi:hypothetical protein